MTGGIFALRPSQDGHCPSARARSVEIYEPIRQLETAVTFHVSDIFNKREPEYIPSSPYRVGKISRVSGTVNVTAIVRR